MASRRARRQMMQICRTARDRDTIGKAREWVETAPQTSGRTRMRARSVECNVTATVRCTGSRFSRRFWEKREAREKREGEHLRIVLPPYRCAGAGSTLVLFLAIGGCAPDPERAMNETAESYVKLVLAMGAHDPDYVDAYYGPPEWREAVAADTLPLDTIVARGRQLQVDLEGIAVPADAELLGLRRRYLIRQLGALTARAQMLAGRTYTFDEEAVALYDAAPPRLPESHFREILAELDRALPGSGPVQDRYVRFRDRFVIPPDRVDTVFRRAIAACEERTARHLTLPDGESFTVEYVTDKSWSGYNWYQGNYRSLIQVNVDLPIYVDRAVDLACHEGYPGHHTYNALLEKNLVRDRGWVEYSVYPLFSPQSLIAEGSANYGIRIAFPGEERVAFERDELFPLAGLDTGLAAEYYRVQELADRLAYAGNEAARRYLNGEIGADSAAVWLETYALMAPARARQRVHFIDQYRSYVINYNLGQDLVAAHIAATAGSPVEHPEAAWREFGRLLSTPRLPSGLVK
jgi:hypothetical protein